VTKRERVSDEAWRAARVRYESDPAVTLSDIAKSLEITRQAVSKRATRYSWQKYVTPRQSAEIAREMGSDMPGKVSYKPAQRPETSASVDTMPAEIRPGLSVVPASADATPVAVSVDESDEAKRTEVMGRHEREMNALRVKIYSALKPGDRNSVPDFTDARAIKTMSDAIRNLHEMERRHFRIDEAHANAKPAITINRVPGKRIT
jgi:hypothetical protein